MVVRWVSPLYVSLGGGVFHEFELRGGCGFQITDSRLKMRLAFGYRLQIKRTVDN